MLRSEIDQGNIQKYHAVQEATTIRLLQSLLKSPEQFYERAEW